MRWLSAPAARAICPQDWRALDMTRATLRVLAFATFVALGVSASAQPQPGAAPTAEDYRAKAAEACAAAAHHRWMARPGRGKQGTGGPSFHHKKLAEQLFASASEYEELARREEAKGNQAPERRER